MTVSMRATVVNKKTAAALPATSSDRSTGLMRSGSSDPLSRSPAVESIARYIPPTNNDTRIR
jgi:hypothetical protein